MAVDLVQRLLEVVLVQVAGGDDLHVVKAQEGVGVAGAHHAPTDDTHEMRPEGAVLPSRPKALAGMNGGRSQRKAGGGEEAAAADAGGE